LLLIPFQFKSLAKLSKKEFLSYSYCGLALASGFSLQTIGISYTPPGKSGILTGLLVVFVPFIHSFFFKEKIGIYSILGACISFIGLCFFSIDSILEFSFKLGDLLLIGGAICYALHIVLIENVYRSFQEADELGLATVQIGICFLFGVLFSSIHGWSINNLNTLLVMKLLYLSLLGSLLAYIVQSWAQRTSPPSHVGVILCTEAIFAYIFSYFLLNESLTPAMFTGAVIIFIGMLVIQKSKT
jgi:drug/metabolite transporter (DMT)-like permease